MQTKTLTVRRFGWKRVANNMYRFGWDLADATQHTQTRAKTTYEGRINYSGNVDITPHTSKSTKIRVILDFVRYDEYIPNLGSISVLEAFYNLIYFIRFIVGTFLPFSAILFIPPFAPLLGSALFGSEHWNRIIGIPVILFIVWIVGIFLEWLFSFISWKILSKKSS